MSSNSRPTLGVVAISKNEEVDMPYFLDHLITWVNEIVIVDDCSEDKTQEIVQSYSSKVKLIEQRLNFDNGGFAAQRNRGIEEAESDWLLHMDIDERVPFNLASEMLKKIQHSEFNAYRYRRLNFFLHRPMKGGGWQDWNRPQLARQGHHFFENSVHENCIIKGGEIVIGQLHQKMWHLNDSSYLERMEKSYTYCQDVANKIHSEGKKIYPYHFIFMPLKEFLLKFIYKKGFKDGVLGLIWALHTSSAIFKAYSLVWDKQNRIARPELKHPFL